MLSHFELYRPEIESLLNEYRTNPKESLGLFDSASQELQDMKEISSVERLISMTLGTWFENPYSLEAVKQFHKDVLSKK